MKTTTTTKPAKREPRIDMWQCTKCYKVHPGRRSKNKVCDCCGTPSQQPR
jgi:rRNA maturation endonuclease Nob1